MFVAGATATLRLVTVRTGTWIRVLREQFDKDELERAPTVAFGSDWRPVSNAIRQLPGRHYLVGGMCGRERTT